MVLEFCENGSLNSFLKSKENITWPFVFDTAIDILSGLLCLHYSNPPIVHRDLKSLNLLVTKNQSVKIGDFGTSRFTSGTDLSTLSKVRGTCSYCSPEVYHGNAFTPKSDIFAFSIILWEMVNRCITGKYRVPYTMNDFSIIYQVGSKNLRPTIPPTCPQSISDFMKLCWDLNPDTRPDTKMALQQIQEINQIYIKNKMEWDNICIDKN